MTATRPDWQTLNAYVDGELSVGEAAAVARAVAENRSVAESAATLARLKAAVNESVSPPEIDLPARCGPAPIRWRMPMAAAALAGLLLMGAWLLNPFGAPAGPPWLSQAWSLHDSWANAEPAEPGDTADRARLVLAAASHLGADAFLPDLSAAKLTLSYVRPLAADGSGLAGIHLGYRGTRGCQISLFIMPGPTNLSSELATLGDRSQRVFAWQTAGSAYVLMARGMDGARLALIARSIHRASLEHAPFNTETRTALRASRATSAPCKA